MEANSTRFFILYEELIISLEINKKNTLVFSCSIVFDYYIGIT